MDLGALIAKLLLDATDWTSGIDTALAGLDALASAAEVAGAVSAGALSAAVFAGVDAASSFQQAAMSMEVLLGSADAANAMMKSIRDMAAVTPFDTQNLTEGAQMLMATGFAAEETLPILTALGDAASSMPNGMNEKLPRMIQAFGKINGAGKVTLGVMNQFVKAGIESFDMLAEKMGVSVAEVRSQISKGNVSAAVGLNALMEGINKKYGGMMAKQSQTLQGVMSTFMDSVKVPLSDMAKPLVDALSKAIPAITAILPGLLSGLKPLFDGLAKGAEAVGWLAAQFGKLSAPMQVIVSYGVSGMMAFAVALGVAATAADVLVPQILSVADTVVSTFGEVSAGAVDLVSTIMAGIAGVAGMILSSVVGVAGTVLSIIAAIGAGFVGLVVEMVPLLASMASFDIFAAAAAVDTAVLNLSMLATMVASADLSAWMATLSASFVAASGSALSAIASLASTAISMLTTAASSINLSAMLATLSTALVAAAGSALSSAGALLSAAAAALAFDAAGGPLLIIVGGIAMLFASLAVSATSIAVIFGTIAAVITGTLIAALVTLYELWLNDFGGMQEIAGALYAVVSTIPTIVEAIGIVISSVATEWLASMGIMTHGTDGLMDALELGMEAASTFVSDKLESLRQGFIDMASDAIAAVQTIVEALMQVPGMQAKMAGVGMKLSDAQYALNDQRSNFANVSKLDLILPDLSGWVDEAKAGLTDYGKTLQNMLSGEVPGGKGGSSSDAAKAAKDAAQAAKDYEEAHAEAVAAEMMLMGTGPAIQASMLRDSMAAMDQAVKDSADTIDEMNKIYAEAAKAVEEFRKGLLDTVLTAAGDVGSVIKSGLEGFATGGIKGALAAVAVQLLTLSPGFQKLSDGINKVLGDIMTSFDPLFNGAAMVLIPAMQVVGQVFAAMVPVFELMGSVWAMLAPSIEMVITMMQVVSVIFQVFANMMGVVGPILELAFQGIFIVMKGVAFVVLGIAWAIGKVWNGILEIIITVLEVISKVTNKVDNAIAALEDMKVDTAGTADAMQTLANTTYESAYATANASVQTSMMADSAMAATEALSNVPSGYKIALARFDAITAESSAQSRAASSASSQRRGEGGITINIAAITAADPADLFDRLEKEANKRRYRKTGVSVPTAPRFLMGS